MRKSKPHPCWYFVDESGDPTFYGKHQKLIVGQNGCSPVLIIGFIAVADPRPIRQAVLGLQRRIVADPVFHKEPYISRTAVAFHAKNDHPDVRLLFFDLIASLEIRAEIMVARKIERIFVEKDGRNQNSFYDHIVSRLFECSMHKHAFNKIYFAKRGARNRQKPLEDAIRKGVERFEHWRSTSVDTSIEVQSQVPSDEPCLSVIDYINWAVHRAYVHQDMRFFNRIRTKVSMVTDLYDTANRPNHWYYHKKNPFHIEKTTPLELDSYI